MTDFQQLARINFLPELETLDLLGKAQAIQSVIEKNFYHPSGLFYSILLISGEHELRPMNRDDMVGMSDIAAEGFYDNRDGGATSEAARNEGMTFENSITSAGLYLQAQAARYTVTGERDAYEQGVLALRSLRLIYDYSKVRGNAGWLGKPYGLIPRDHSTPDQYLDALLGLYEFLQIAEDPERERIEIMLRDIADFLIRRNYQTWNLNAPIDDWPYNLREAYCNATYVLAEAIAFRVTGEERYRAEAFRVAGLSFWRDHSQLDEWVIMGWKRVLMFERVCLGAFVQKTADALYDILPELFGETLEAAKQAMARLQSEWWVFSQLGNDDDFYKHYWIDIDVVHKTWRATGIRPNDNPPYPGTFGSYYSDVRESDSFYRAVRGALPVIAHVPEQREATRAWVREALLRTTGNRLRAMIDLDGQQLKPDVLWMNCILSSEAPFHYLYTYWRGRQLGYWQ